MRGRPIDWLPEELAWISDHRDWPREELHAGFCARFGRDVSLGAIKGLCKRNRWSTGRTGHFAKGGAPANKGQKMPFNPRSAACRFQPGSTPANAIPVGTERVNVYGYVEVKVAEPNPYTGHATRFVAKHVHAWKKANGPVPDGHVLKCLDGNRQNCAADNWQAIPQALLPRLAGRWNTPYDTAEPEVKPVLLAIATLQHATRQKRKRHAGATP